MSERLTEHALPSIGESPRPVSAHERIDLIDVVRGFALFGVLLANLTGVGFGWYGDVGPAVCVGLALLIFAAQMAFSRWWLARYRFGPAEWGWRTLTYGQIQPMRAPVPAHST